MIYDKILLVDIMSMKIERSTHASHKRFAKPGLAYICSNALDGIDLKSMVFLSKIRNQQQHEHGVMWCDMM